MEHQGYSQTKGEGAEKEPLPNRESDEAHHHESNGDDYAGNSGVH